MSDPAIPALREFAQLPLLKSGEGAKLLLSLVRADGSTGESVALAGDLIEQLGPAWSPRLASGAGLSSANRTWENRNEQTLAH